MSGKNTINWIDYCSPCKSWCCYDENPFASDDELKKLNVSKIITKKDGSCIFLNHFGNCSKYEDRPFECRIFPFDIQEIEDKLVWIVWTNCPAYVYLNYESMITLFESKFIKKWNIDYIKKYVEYHKTNQPKKYLENKFKILRDVIIK